METLFEEIRQQKKFGRLTPLLGTNLTTVFGQDYVESMGLREADLDRMRLFIEYNKLHEKIAGVLPSTTSSDAYIDACAELVGKLDLFAENVRRLAQTFEKPALLPLIEHTIREVEAARNVEWFFSCFRKWRSRCHASTQILSAITCLLETLRSLPPLQVDSALRTLSSACFDRASIHHFSEACQELFVISKSLDLYAPEEVLLRYGEYARTLFDCDGSEVLPHLYPCEQGATDKIFGATKVLELLLEEPTHDQLEDLYLIVSQGAFDEVCITPAEIAMCNMLSGGIKAVYDAVFLNGLGLTFSSNRLARLAETTKLMKVLDSGAIIGELFGFSYGKSFDILCNILGTLLQDQPDAEITAVFWSCKDFLQPWLPEEWPRNFVCSYYGKHGVQSRSPVLDYTEADHRMYEKWSGATGAAMQIVNKSASEQDSTILDITRRRLLEVRQHTRRSSSAILHGQCKLITPKYILEAADEVWDDCWSYTDV